MGSIQVTILVSVILVVSLTLIGITLKLAYEAGRDTAENVRKKRLAKRLYTYANNGVIAFVRAEDYEQVAEAFWDRVKNGSEIWRPSDEPPLFKVEPVVAFGFAPSSQKAQRYLSSKCEIERRPFRVPVESSPWAIVQEFYNEVHGRPIPL